MMGRAGADQWRRGKGMMWHDLPFNRGQRVWLVIAAAIHASPASEGVDNKIRRLITRVLSHDRGLRPMPAKQRTAGLLSSRSTGLYSSAMRGCAGMRLGTTFPSEETPPIEQTSRFGGACHAEACAACESLST